MTMASILTELRTANEQRDRMHTEMRAGFDRVDTQMGELRTEMRAGFDRVDAILVRMDGRVAQLDERVARIEGQRG